MHQSNQPNSEQEISLKQLMTRVKRIISIITLNYTIVSTMSQTLCDNNLYMIIVMPTYLLKDP